MTDCVVRDFLPNVIVANSSKYKQNIPKPMNYLSYDLGLISNKAYFQYHINSSVSVLILEICVTVFLIYNNCHDVIVWSPLQRV